MAKSNFTLSNSALHNLTNLTKKGDNVKNILQNEALNRIKTLMNSNATSEYHIDCQAQLIEEQPAIKGEIRGLLHEINVINTEIIKWIDALLEETQP